MNTALSMRLERIQYACEQCSIFEFRAPHADPPPAPAGAHVQIYLPDGNLRAYSVLNPDEPEPRYVVAVKHAAGSRGCSRWLHEHARVGMHFDILPPQNNFSLNEGASHSLLFAGGIGITPLWSMVQRLERLRASWKLIYGVRNHTDIVFAKELAALGDRVQFVFSRGQASSRHIDFRSELAGAPNGTHFYCCGPKSMMDAFESATAALGLPPQQCHVEFFTPREEAARGGDFTVHLARSGRSITVPAGLTILDALLAQGIDAPRSCEQGVCGTCETRVLEGTPDHRDAVLSDSERSSSQTMMICCSGCVGSRLVLDL